MKETIAARTYAYTQLSSHLMASAAGSQYTLTVTVMRVCYGASNTAVNHR